jgi:electron transport complex protein RnfB
MNLALGWLAFSLSFALIGQLLGAAARRWPKAQADSLVTALDECLPQWQCGQCAYPGCRPYAEAIARGEAEINRCPPGGETTLQALARLLNREPPPLDSQYGLIPPAQVAFIREAECIGCALCLKACPVDAIVGAPKQLHTVIATHCTGCALCVAPCPTDCIELHPADDSYP